MDKVQHFSPLDVKLFVDQKIELLPLFTYLIELGALIHENAHRFKYLQMRVYFFFTRGAFIPTMLALKPSIECRKVSSTVVDAFQSQTDTNLCSYLALLQVEVDARATIFSFFQQTLSFRNRTVKIQRFMLFFD